MYAEGLRHAGAEAIRLNERANERADIVNAGSFDEIPQGLGAGLAGAHLKVHKMELVTEIGVGVVKILADPHESLVKSEARFNADDGEVEGVGQADADAILAVSDHALQNKAGEQEAEGGDADDQGGIIQSGESHDQAEADGSHQNAGAEVVVDINGIAESGLDQPFARAGNIGG